MTSDLNHTLFLLLRAALTGYRQVTLTKDLDWMGLLDLACNHGVAAIALDGLQKLKEDNDALVEYFDAPENEDVKYEWLGCVLDTESQNAIVNQRAKELTTFFYDRGFRTCILKGQGNALYYPIPEHRQSGDIDLWVDGNRDAILNTVSKSGIKVGHVDVKHSDMEFFSDTPVEIHFNPSYSYNPITGKRLRKWTSRKSESQFSSYDSAIGFAHATTDFNLVYCLMHLYRHLFSEGVGLKQVVDYYCILVHSDSTQREDAFHIIDALGMRRFASGMMWVLEEIFDIDDSFLLCSKDEQEGRFLLNEFMCGAGFGRYDERNVGIKESGYFARGLTQFRKNLRFLTHYPQEVLWSPLWKFWHWCWRKWKGYL